MDPEPIKTVNFLEKKRLHFELEYWYKRLNYTKSEEERKQCEIAISKIRKKIYYIDTGTCHHTEELMGRRKDLNPLDTLIQDKIREDELNGLHNKKCCNQLLSKLGKE